MIATTPTSSSQNPESDPSAFCLPPSSFPPELPPTAETSRALPDASADFDLAVGHMAGSHMAGSQAFHEPSRGAASDFPVDGTGAPEAMGAPAEAHGLERCADTDETPCHPALKDAPVPSTLLFTVPAEAQEIYKRLPFEVREEFCQLAATLAAVHRAANKTRACALFAAQSNGRWRAQTLRTKYCEYMRTRDWLVLVNKAKAGPAFWEADASIGLPDAFVEFWRGLVDRNQRKISPAYRELLRIWRTHQDARGRMYKVIPGYSAWPEADPFTCVPKGWSLDTLTRKASNPFELAAARQGRRAAAAYRPKVLTTRVGLRVGQYILFDDQEYDLRVNFLGVQRRAMRPLGLDALDLFSGCFIAHGFKPTVWDEIDEVKRKLKLSDMRWLVAHVLMNIGFRADTGTVFVMEHGTATISDEFEQRILRVTGGKVKVERSGMLNQPAFAGLFEPQGAGNPRFKAPLESAYNLVRNEFAALPAQVGMDRQHAPEQAYGLNKYNDLLLRACEALAPERRALLKFPALNWHEFISLALHFYSAIDRRTEHALEGWEKAGLIAHEWRVLADSQTWRTANELATMSDAQRSAIEALIAAQPELYRTRKLSPFEVWQSGKRSLTKVPGYLLPDLLGVDAARQITVSKDGFFLLEDQELTTEPLRFLARVRDGAREMELSAGETYLVYVNPFDLRSVQVCEARPTRLGAYLGCAQQWDRLCRTETDALQRRCGEVAKLEAAMLQPLARRGAELTRERIEMHRHNEAVLSGKPVTAEELRAAREADRDLKRELRKGDELAADLQDVQLSPSSTQVDPFQMSPEQVAEILGSDPLNPNP